MGGESNQVGGGNASSHGGASADSPKPQESSKLKKASHPKKSTSPLLPHDSDFERDPREDDSFAEREKDYLRDKPPHHSS